MYFTVQFKLSMNYNPLNLKGHQQLALFHTRGELTLNHTLEIIVFFLVLEDSFHPNPESPVSSGFTAPFKVQMSLIL